MIKLLRYLFTVQYDYRDSTQATRARILLPLISSIALLAFILGVYLLIVVLFGFAPPSTTGSIGYLIAPFLILSTTLALWLTQKGHIQIAAFLMTLLLLGASVSSLYTDGITAGAVLTLPPLLMFVGLAYGNWGILVITLAFWVGLSATAYLQSEGTLDAPIRTFDNLLREALISAQMLTLLAIIFWVFTWNLQNALTRTARIAAQTRATATIGQTLSRILNMGELLTHAVDLIRDRFAYYHVQLFIMSDSGDFADLAASTGDIGSTLLEQGFRVPVGSRTVVGEVASKQDLIYVSDINQAPYHHPDLLPDTRSELAMPLIIGDTITGVLDIQSTRTNAFSPEDIEAMRIVANQVSQAVQNAQLFESQQRNLLQNRRLFLESETNLREIERLNRQLTAESWEDYMLERNIDQIGIRVSGDTVEETLEDWTTPMQHAIERQRSVSQKHADEQILAVPITIRGQAVGAVEVRLGDNHNQAEARSTLQAITERMAFSLENARLFEQAQVSAEREQQINQISAQLQGLTTVDDVMMMALSTLGDVLQADYGAIRLAGRELLTSDNSANAHEKSVSSKSTSSPHRDPKRSTQPTLPAANNDTDHDTETHSE